MDSAAAPWGERWFIEATAAAKLVYLHLLDHPGCSPLGLVAADWRSIAAATGLPRGEVVAALADLQAEVLGGPGLYWVRRRLSLRPPTTPSQVLTWGPDLGRLPPGDLRDLVALASGTVALGLRESLYDLVPAECLDALRQKKMREVAE